MLFVVTAIVGIAGTVFFGLHRDAGELQRIFSLMSLFLVAAAVVGTLVDDGKRDPARARFTTDEKVQLAVGVPLGLFMTGVLLFTLVPCIYVMLPFFGAMRVIASSRRPRELPPAPAEAEPAYA